MYVNEALTASLTVFSYVVLFCSRLFFLSCGIPNFSGSSAKFFATSSLDAASRRVSHEPFLATRRKVLFLYARRLPLASRFRMNWVMFSGTCSSVGIVCPSSGLSMAIFRVVSSVMAEGSSGKISM